MNEEMFESLDPHENAVPPKAPKAKKASDLEVARSVVENWPNHLAFVGGKAYQLVLYDHNAIEGWVECTSALRAAVVEAKGNWADGVWKIIESRLQIPDAFAFDNPPSFWERSSNHKWESSWLPLYPTLNEVVFCDCIKDVKTGEERAISDKVIWGPLITMSCLKLLEPENLDFEHETPFQTLLKNSFGEGDNGELFQELMSTILQPHRIIRRQIVLYGVPHSGKTSLATAICCAPSGQRGLSTAQDAQLVRDKWCTTMLLGKFANLSDDSAQTPHWVPFLKQYTSGRMICEPKGISPFSAVPTAKLISTCNDLPDLADGSGAAGDRFYPFEFTKRLKEMPDLNQERFMHAAYWSQLRQRKEVLRWLWAGLERLIQRGEFKYPKGYQEKREELRGQADPIEGDLKQVIKKSAEGFIPTHEILQRYPSLTSQKVSAYMLRLFPGCKATKRTKNGTQVRGYSGVAYDD